MAGMVRSGLMISITNKCGTNSAIVSVDAFESNSANFPRKNNKYASGYVGNSANSENTILASRNFACLMNHVTNLYCVGGSSSVSAQEINELVKSVSYVLGIENVALEEVASVLNFDNPIALWQEGVVALNRRTVEVLELWEKVVATMTPIRNVALRDTLVSLGAIKQCYDVYFAAHEVPCSIDYQLHKPLDSALMGIDYVEEWLSVLLFEVQWIAQFEMESCVAVLERICPDYRGLHVNLYELLLSHEEELVRVELR